MSRSGAGWTGPYNPAPVSVKIPNRLSLVGAMIYGQGFLLDTAFGLPALGLADAFEFEIGL